MARKKRGAKLIGGVIVATETAVAGKPRYSPLPRLILVAVHTQAQRTVARARASAWRI